MNINNENLNNVLRAIIIKPEKEIPEIIDIQLNVPIEEVNKATEKNEVTKTFDDDLRELLNIEGNKLPVYAALCAPLQNFVMVINPDMFDNDSEYNYGYIGSPLFGNVLILETKIDEIQDEATETTLVAKMKSMDTKIAEVLCTFFECLKKEERVTKIRENIINEINSVGKRQFLENLVNDNVRAGNTVDVNTETGLEEENN